MSFANMARKRARRQGYSTALFSGNISAHHAVLLGEAGGSNVKDGKNNSRKSIMIFAQVICGVLDYL